MRTITNQFKRAHVILVALLMIQIVLPRSRSLAEVVSAKSFKVLHLMSYHAEWPWNQEQFKGFQYALRDVRVEYKIFEMDLKRHSSQEWVEAVSRQARELIDSWHPDLIYANDDAAQEHVTIYYVNTDIPIVFSAVNASPETYGFVGSSNVTGVLEQEHFFASVRLLQTIVPHVKRIAVIFDSSPMWNPVIGRMKSQLELLPEIESIHWEIVHTFDDYQKKILSYQDTVDALGLLGIFHFKDRHGANVPYTDVLRWTAEQSRLPDFTYWDDRIKYGTLCAVAVSGYEQGLAAGKLAYGILQEGRKPSSYPMLPTMKGEPVISLARARKLGLRLDSDLLLTSEIVTMFEWEK